jgi:hypothetical protein
MRAADDVGMLVSLSVPNAGPYDWKAPDAEETNGYPYVSCAGEQLRLRGSLAQASAHVPGGVQRTRPAEKVCVANLYCTQSPGRKATSNAWLAS